MSAKCWENKAIVSNVPTMGEGPAVLQMGPSPQKRVTEASDAACALKEDLHLFSEFREIDDRSSVSIKLQENICLFKCPWSETSTLQYSREIRRTVLLPEHVRCVPSRYGYRLKCPLGAGGGEAGPALPI